MAVVDIGEHIVIAPEIVHGQMTFRGTRVPVDMVLAYVARGLSIDEVGKHWPQVSREAAAGGRTGGVRKTAVRCGPSRGR